MGFGSVFHSVSKVVKKVGNKAGPKAIASHVKTLGQKSVKVAAPLAAASLSYSTLGATQHYTDSKIKHSKTLGGGTRFAGLASKTTRDYNRVARPVEAGLAIGGLGMFAGAAYAPAIKQYGGAIASGALEGGQTALTPARHGATTQAGGISPATLAALGLAALATLYLVMRK